MPYYTHRDTVLHWAEKGSGEPLVFLHGLGGNIEQVMSIYEPTPGTRLVTFDFRGHGQTPPGSPEQLGFSGFADDLLALLAHLGIGRAIVGGISMGAGVALNFCLRYPEKVTALILLRPAWLDGPMEPPVQEMFREVARHIQEYGPAAGRQLFTASGLYRRLHATAPGTARSLLVHFDYAKARETAVKLERLPADAPCANREEWKKIAVPVLVMANKSDPVHPFAYGLEYAAALPKASFREVTPKAVSEERHRCEVQEAIGLFVSGIADGGNLL